jgi:hypothetical protein
MILPGGGGVNYRARFVRIDLRLMSGDEIFEPDAGAVAPGGLTAGVGSVDPTYTLNVSGIAFDGGE